jgi:type I restriction enzyme S subunit
MEHIEAHTMKLFGTVPAATMKSSAVHFKPGDVLYGRLRPYLNKVYRPAFEGLCSAEFIVLPETELIDGKYLQYFLNSGAFVRFASHLNAGDRPRVDFDQIANRDIPLPRIDEQRRIVAEIEKQFSRLDEAVANLKRVKANLKHYRAGVLDEFFGDEPNARLGDAIKSGPQNGLYLPKSAYGTGSPILRIDDFQTDWIRPAGELRCVAASEAQVAAWALREGELVINRVNSISHLGKCVSVPASLAGVLFESNMMRLGLKANAMPRYVELYLGGALGRRRLTQQAKWAVNQASINQQDVMATPLPLPDVDMQRRIVAEVDRRLSIVREVEAEVDANLKRAQALRQAVLARAFTGSPDGLGRA